MSSRSAAMSDIYISDSASCKAATAIKTEVEALADRDAEHSGEPLTEIGTRFKEFLEHADSAESLISRMSERALACRSAMKYPVRLVWRIEPDVLHCVETGRWKAYMRLHFVRAAPL